jgi:hypothetical protein
MVVSMRDAKPAALLLAALMVTTAAMPLAEARPRPAGRTKSNFEANKTFGLGIMLGGPSGLSGKYFVGPSTAIDFGVGYHGCCRYRNHGGLHLHADYLWHPVSLVSAEAFELPFYVGVGGRFWDWDHDNDYDGEAIGVRVPFGLAFDFNEVPIDIFVELVPVLDFFFGADCGPGDDYCDGVNFDIMAAIGFRYYFS